MPASRQAPHHAICVPPPTQTAEKTGNILLDLRRGQANPLLAALKVYQQAVVEGNLLLVTYECASNDSLIQQLKGSVKT